MTDSTPKSQFIKKAVSSLLALGVAFVFLGTCAFADENEVSYSFVKKPYYLHYSDIDSEDFYEWYIVSIVQDGVDNHLANNPVQDLYIGEYENEIIDAVGYTFDVSSYEVPSGIAVTFSNKLYSSLDSQLISYIDLWFIYEVDYRATYVAHEAFIYPEMRPALYMYNEEGVTTTTIDGLGTTECFPLLQDGSKVSYLCHFNFQSKLPFYLGDDIGGDNADLIAVNPVKNTVLSFGHENLTLGGYNVDYYGVYFVDGYVGVPQPYVYGYGSDINWSDVYNGIPHASDYLGNSIVPSVPSTNNLIEMVWSLPPVLSILTPLALASVSWLTARYLLNKGV